MRSSSRNPNWYRNDTGATLMLTTALMVVVLGVSALGIDMAQLYVVRGEAQRAADAAALAGGEVFVRQGCTTFSGGCVAGGPQEAMAQRAAEDIASQNLANGKAVVLQQSDIAFNYPNPEEPEVTVTVQLTKARNTAPLTFFANVFGIGSADVTASATAEAFNPSGGNAQVGIGCVKPFLMPNCDYSHTSGPHNPLCPGGTADYFFDPTSGALEHPGTWPNGVVGQPWSLHLQAAPSQWFLIGYTGNSGSALRTYIEECAPSYIACNSVQQTADGKKVGPTDQGTNTLIHANGDGLNQGQDSIDTSTGPPFPITGGSNNPNSNLVGQTFYSPSDSIAAVPVYDGHQLTPGIDSATIIGYFQVFFKDAIHHGNDDQVDVIILNVVGCGSGGSGISGSPPPLVTSNGGTPIPVRLIHK
jgi:hypothetical protein